MVFLLRLLTLFLGMVSILTGANNTMAQTQSQGSQERTGSAQGGGSQSIGQASPGGAVVVRGSSGGSSVRVVPSMTVSERYDSNVRLSTPEVHDYVTLITPRARVEYRDDLVEGNLTGGFTSQLYARNPELNYVGANSSIVANLDNVVGRMIRGLGLRVTDSMMYTPEPLAFVTPEVPETSSFYGIQATRNNTLINAANIQGTYAISPSAQLNASYTHNMRKFLNQPGSGNNSALFNTIIQTFSTGPQYQITPSQLIGGSYQYQHFSSEPNTGGMGAVTVVHGGMVTWKSSLTRELTLEVSPGVSILTNLPERPRWTMRGSLQWSDGRTSAGLSYVRSVRPGMFISASNLISDVVAASLSQNLTSEWSVSAQSSYAVNTSIGQTSLRFVSFAETGSLNYAFYPGMVATASITYYHFLTEGIQNREFDRKIAMVSVTADWN